jgi:hypothetical protein
MKPLQEARALMCSEGGRRHVADQVLKPFGYAMVPVTKTRVWTIHVCPACGAMEVDEPSGCGHCERGGHLAAILVAEIGGEDA